MSNLKIERVLEVAEADECLGFCTRCGAEIEGVEPKVRNYPCPTCGSETVSGTEELLVNGLFAFDGWPEDTA